MKMLMNTKTIIRCCGNQSNCFAEQLGYICLNNKFINQMTRTNEQNTLSPLTKTYVQPSSPVSSLCAGVCVLYDQ